MIKSQLHDLLYNALCALQHTGQLPPNTITPDNRSTLIEIDRCKSAQHGDFSCNIAMKLTKLAKQPPRQLATALVDILKQHLQNPTTAATITATGAETTAATTATTPTTATTTDTAATSATTTTSAPAANAATTTSTPPLIEKIDIAGPGFINFFIHPQAYHALIRTIHDQKETFGQSQTGGNQRIHIEYVSANPTGPLHVGHGRGAAYGDCIARLLSATGHHVTREYYVNDAGRQMQILALSTWIRYLQHLGMDGVLLPPNAYQGHYIVDIAKALAQRDPNAYRVTTEQLNHHALDLDFVTHPDRSLDTLIRAAIDSLGEPHFQAIKQFALEHILADIKEDLADFGVTFDVWFPESQLLHHGLLELGIEQLKSHGHVYTRDGAIWFRATDFGDEKDRVLIRENGQSTYFASDVAYHLFKYQQGYDRLIDVFGADHHGYIPRIRAFLQGLSENPDKLSIQLVQFANLYRGDLKIPMSTRSGDFVTLRALRDEVGNDAARYFYIMRKPEQHLDFDLELAKSRSEQNPVYYIQYAHARICSVWRELEKQAQTHDLEKGLAHLDRLITEHEQKLIVCLSRYTETVEAAARLLEPHLVAFYLHDLANCFHSYYNANKFLVDDAVLCQARLTLILACQFVLHNGLNLLGVSAPEQM